MVNLEKPSQDAVCAITSHHDCNLEPLLPHKAILGYWNIRGLAQPIRLALEYTQTPYEDKLYVAGEAPGYSRDDWLSHKPHLGLAFPNLPYFIDGKFKLTESNAILRYIGSKNNLCGATAEEGAIVDMVLGHAYDWRSTVSKYVYSGKKYDEVKDNLQVEYTKYLKDFEGYISNKNNKKYIAGDSISIADFVVYEILDVGKTMFGEILKKGCPQSASICREF